MNRAFALDLVERTVSTYVQALLGLLTADSTHLLSLGAVRAAAVAALPAAYAVLKGALAGSLGTAGSASLVPPAPLPLSAGSVPPPEPVAAAAPTASAALDAADPAPVPAGAPVVQTAPADPAVTG